MNRTVIKMLLAAVWLTVLLGCAGESDGVNCESGYQLAQEGEFQKAIPALNACIDAAATDPETRRLAYVARAWANYSLRNIASAVADQEAAFRISEPDSYHELINYALYLRLDGRVDESLVPLRKAEAMEAKEGVVSMMTQYQLGWTLQDLGQHAEAVAVFSRGVPYQKDFPFVYLRRGVSLDALGRKSEARSDFAEGMRLAKQRGDDLSAKELAPIRKKILEYGVD